MSIELNNDSYALEDRKIIDTLNRVKTIALIGASARPDRDSFKVMAFLINEGYQVIPINPLLAGTTILEQQVFASISDIPSSIDMLDVFRQSKYLYDIVVEAKKANITTIWTQLGVTDLKTELFAQESGITMIVNRCPAIEIPRLGLKNNSAQML
ncbi:CoA-binding protein [Colwellia psychrerythraea]|uniref:CoA-binding domain protein n=1 Tax=Colwellia psychrerythraea TaxID=28229 RepID=A0A099KC10_COLPS|nr:CoA-binding protein [Colwellia psychrerythraea]KGJ87562.1 CoA-binding domain protein [Colwellia psychrerythraea]